MNKNISREEQKDRLNKLIKMLQAKGVRIDWAVKIPLNTGR